MPNDLITSCTKNELIGQLVSFCATDTLLYLPNCSETDYALHVVNQVLQTEYVFASGVDVLAENISQGFLLKQYLMELNEDEIVFIYQVGKELRSVLLAILLAEHQLDVNQVFSIAFYEELQQQQKWGQTDEVKVRHQSILQTLQQLEKTYDKRSVS